MGACTCFLDFHAYLRYTSHLDTHTWRWLWYCIVVGSGVGDDGGDGGWLDVIYRVRDGFASMKRDVKSFVLSSPYDKSRGFCCVTTTTTMGFLKAIITRSTPVVYREDEKHGDKKNL